MLQHTRFFIPLTDSAAPCSHSLFVLDPEPVGFQYDAGCVDSGGDLHNPRRAARTAAGTVCIQSARLFFGHGLTTEMQNECKNDAAVSVA